MSGTGVRLGLDVGRARIGVARSDSALLLATPVETVARDLSGAGADISRIAAIIDEIGAVGVVVGLPLALSGSYTASTNDSVEFARRVAEARPETEVRLVDERLTTVSAQGALHRSGKKTKGSRQVIDQIAAVILLQHAIDAERATGSVAGALVDSTTGP